MTTYSKILEVAETHLDDDGVAHFLPIVKKHELNLRALLTDSRPYENLWRALDGWAGYDIDPNSTYAQLGNNIDCQQLMLWGMVCVLVVFLEKLGETINWEVCATAG